MNKGYFLLFAVLFLFSCANKYHNKASDKSEPCLDTIPIHYAKGFAITANGQYVSVKVFNSSDNNEKEQVYYLVKDSMIETPDAAHTIVIPLQTIALTSCTHIPFVEKLGYIDVIKAVCSPHLLYNSYLRQKYEQKKIQSLGDAFNLNIENIIVCKPSAIVVTAYEGQDEMRERLENYGIKVLIDNEWKEETVLGRAEWIKFFAAFFDCQSLADSLFSDIETAYLSAQQLAQSYKTKPSVMPGGNYRGTWYVPGGQTYMANLFKDANAAYYYANDNSTESLPLNFEKALEVFANAEIWLNAPACTKAELFNADERHGLFKAFKNNEIYAFKKRINEDGANDFWETAVVEPHFILHDMIWAVHQEEKDKGTYQPKYLIKVE
ncbi:MAG: ABC transporter substrate-binding protein [Bacteroidales bacterium]|nr:ABC transporter substrate-binding protein [Bacteroidales bacterium]